MLSKCLYLPTTWEKAFLTECYYRNMAIILKDFNHVTVVDGELVPSSNEFDLADLLGNFDYGRIIKMQFDRLDASFQEILTVRFFFSSYTEYNDIFEYRLLAAWTKILHSTKLKQ